MSFGLSNPVDVPANPVDQLLARLTPGAHLSSTKPNLGTDADILAKLSEQQALLGQQQRILADNQARRQENSHCKDPPSGTQFSVPRGRPLAETDGNQSLEMLRLKQELVAANSRIAMQEQELAQSRVIKQTFDQALGSPADPEFMGRDVTEQSICNLQNAFNDHGRSFNPTAEAWTTPPDDAGSDISDNFSVTGYSRARRIWNNPAPNNAFTVGSRDPFPVASTDPRAGWTARVAQPGYHLPGNFSPPPPRDLPNSQDASSVGADDRFVGDQMFAQGANNRVLTQPSRNGACFPLQSSPWTAFSSVQPMGRGTPSPYYPQQVSLFNAPAYQPQPIGTPLSPTAAEFTSTNTAVTSSAMWDSSAVSVYSQ